ncbi:MAG: leucine-rich repeat protein [Clostridia bacterium]|nr:leucine-rich repeat protein [Clostridia bacterium]
MKKKIQTSRKRLLSVLLAVAMVLTALPLTVFSAAALTSGDFAYWILSEEEKTCCISQYTGSETDVSIPYAIDGYTVTRIGDMESIFTNTPQVESVTIPAGVTEIWFSQGALYSPALRAVNIEPENPTFSSVDGVVFSKDKTALYLYPRAKADVTAYEIPYGVEYICVSAFAGCKSLVSITIPDSVTEIGEEAFSGCTSLTSITIPDGVTEIGWSAFANCTALTSITIPNSVTSIGVSAFAECTSLTSITIPNSVTSIGGWVFNHCTALTSIAIPNSVTSIDEMTFSYCTSLASITIPNSVTSIGLSAFKGCASLTSIEIPNSVTSIGGHAFFGCTALTNITIPNSVTSIGDSAFSGCASLTSVAVAAGNPNYISENGVLFNKAKTELIQYPASKPDTSYTIQNSVTSIGGWAFEGSSSLTSITIPNSVTSIGVGAFYNCTLLTSIEIPNSVTSIGYDAFYGSGLTTIYGYTDSYAETYANENGYTFVALSSGNKGGDINGDDKINAVDARFVLQAASGLRVLDDTQKAAADVNGDGKINAVDARWILQVASGARTL